MIKNNQFQQLIQKEITELINVPADFKNIQITVNEEYEERQMISIYQMKENSIVITAPCLYDDLNKIISSRKCSKKDLDEAMVGLDDPIIFGTFHNNQLIGAASYWFWGEKIADIGVIVHPEYRKKGVGKFLVSKLCEWGINNQKINLYRHNELNEKSHFLALSLNFKEYFYVEEIEKNSL